MFLIQYAKSDWNCRNRCPTKPRKDHVIAVARVSMPPKKREDLRYFTMKFQITHTESFQIYFSVHRCDQMRDNKRRGHH